MKTLKITKQSQYSTSTLEGSKKEVLSFLRTEAKEKRRGSRQAHKLSDSVHSLPFDAHCSELVTMAAFNLNNCRVERLIALLNGHGVTKYSVA
jgi:hypothetical protein